MKQLKQYEKIKIIKQIPGLFLGCNFHFICITMDIHCKLLPLNKVDFSLSPEKAEKLVRKDCNSFLKTEQGFRYLLMKYPNLSISQAVDEYVKEALRIDSIV